MTNTQYLISRKYLLYRLFSNLWFVSAIWLYFYRIFITDQQVGVLDGIAFTIGLIAEIPSGALADKYGRDKIVRLGLILTGMGFLIQAAGSGFTQFLIGQAILMIGASFVSGADESLFYHALDFKQTSVEWRKLVTRGSQFALVGSLFAALIGGLSHGINPRIPWILTGVSFLIASILIWSVKDTRKMYRQDLSGEIKEYLQQIKSGFLQFLRPELRLYIPTIFVVQGLFYTYGWGLLRLILLDRFHFSPFEGAVAIASSSLITVGLLALTHKYARHVSEKRVLLTISLSAAASLLLPLANIGLWGYVVILTLYIGEHVLYPFMSEVLNVHAPENQRATVLSVASFLRALPYVILAPLIGFLNTKGKLEYFLVGWSLLMCGAVLIYLSRKKRDEQVAIDAVK